ncbi:hypothetical protein G9464_07520 [Halostella sp. JP-L12]|uniref:DUF7310 family coiled-coil domain-containing protein n=1 Tax=Halostella TaxID=1843185 RepID=UPI000EF7F414|nr:MULTISPECIES: hypothetical protein [Halostella]NHN47443.1 hypothetical protein [Halostella sp. JP-L12]
MTDDVEARLDAVERALTGSDADLPALAEGTELVDRVDAAEDRLDAVEERIEELDAATQAVRGYVGNVRSVNEDVERRADAAVAGVEALEARVDELEADGETDRRGSREPPTNERHPTDHPDAPNGNRAGPPLESPHRESEQWEGDHGDAESGERPRDGDRGLVARLREAL